MSFSPKPSLPAMNGVFFASSAFLFCRKTAPGAGRAVLSPPALGCPGWGRPDPHPPTGASEYEDGSMGSIPAGAARLGFPIGGGLERTFAVTGSGSLVLATGKVGAVLAGAWLGAAPTGLGSGTWVANKD